MHRLQAELESRVEEQHKEEDKMVAKVIRYVELIELHSSHT